MHHDKECHELSGSSLRMLALCVTIGAMDWENQKRALTTLDRLMAWGANQVGMRDTDPDPFNLFVYLMKKLVVSNLRENEPLPTPLGSIGRFTRLLAPDISPEWAFAIRDDFDDCDDWSGRPKVEKMLRQHGLIDEDNYVEEEDSDYVESTEGDEDKNGEKIAGEGLERGTDDDEVEDTDEHKEEYVYEYEVQELEDSELKALSGSELGDEDDDQDEKIFDEYMAEGRVLRSMDVDLSVDEIAARGAPLNGMSRN
ncbi:hypothetical protein BDP55DRAFT_725624 [Colletotrichum godetiae]|uniref:Uncharacterized protein n=1 Tax=Colletotrichum godetiae TaxID=1209918 RepID=A0AAJ0EZ91_9PEZI|nr:uncharacterized protein BDP55DRAFT_725624 [Colletotrichum godetiae]KAK1689456.1 hypothetical protein BDP55DRAFT_725624 [Colletotrichum godetiae]